MSLILNGTTDAVTFPDSTIQNTSAVVSGKVPYSVLPTGSVLQVVNFSSSTNFSTSSSSYVSSGITATITPKFSTSKILVLINGSCRIGIGGAFRQTIYRNSTQISGYAQNQQAGSGSIQYLDNGFSLNYLDSPATTSSTTYSLYSLVVGGSVACQINPDGSNSQITLMEIAG